MGKNPCEELRNAHANAGEKRDMHLMCAKPILYLTLASNARMQDYFFKISSETIHSAVLVQTQHNQTKPNNWFKLFFIATVKLQALYC